MTATFSIVLEQLEDQLVDGQGAVDDRFDGDVITRYECAKAGLRDAHACGEGVREATAEFVSARKALRTVLEAFWPGQGASESKLISPRRLSTR